MDIARNSYGSPDSWTNLTIPILEMTDARNFLPSAAAHNATVKPFFIFLWSCSGYPHGSFSLDIVCSSWG